MTKKAEFWQQCYLTALNVELLHRTDDYSYDKVVEACKMIADLSVHNKKTKGKTDVNIDYEKEIISKYFKPADVDDQNPVLLRKEDFVTLINKIEPDFNINESKLKKAISSLGFTGADKTRRNGQGRVGRYYNVKIISEDYIWRV